MCPSKHPRPQVHWTRAMPTIRSLSIFEAVSTAARSIADSTHQISKLAFLVVRIRLDSGITGDGYLLAFHYSPQAILGALIDAAPMALGRDVAGTGEFLAHHTKESEYFG